MQFRPAGGPLRFRPGRGRQPRYLHLLDIRGLIPTSAEADLLTSLLRLAPLGAAAGLLAGIAIWFLSGRAGLPIIALLLTLVRRPAPSSQVAAPAPPGQSGPSRDPAPAPAPAHRDPCPARERRPHPSAGALNRRQRLPGPGRGPHSRGAAQPGGWSR